MPTLGKVNEAFEESPPEYEPPSYNFNVSTSNLPVSTDSRAPPSGGIPLAGGPMTSGSESPVQEFQLTEGAMCQSIDEERTVTPIIPVSL